MRLLRKVILLLAIVSAISYYQIKEWVFEQGPLLDVVNVVIPKGASSALVAENLSEAGVISHPLIFRIYARVVGLDKQLKAGEYQFLPGVAIIDTLEKIANGEVYYHKITIPEGLTSGQIMYMISSYPGLSGEIDLDIKEGELLPETYSFELGATRNSILLQAKTAMKKAKEEIWQLRNEKLPIKNEEEMLVLASIIEKETGIPGERRLVSSVFINRLKKGMRLQTDPTVIYALTEGESDFGRKLSRTDLQVDSPYNTYKNYGLPPGPICNPGKEALLAAIQPEQTNFLYFVANGKGGHNFAASLNEHNTNVQNYRKLKN
ncbi:MAG: endolytic transglycosylase MltG [Alphaproteobacteria bacterium]|nr:endolytic transglycosylase MltG [Alphaproteobacteria bacterium]